MTRRYVRELGVVLRCVSVAHPTLLYPTPTDAGLTVAGTLQPSALRSTSGGPSGLSFTIAHGFAVTETVDAPIRARWSVQSRMYAYRLLDSHHRELLVYHWQPGMSFRGPDHPHVHVSAALDAQVDALTRHEIGLDKRHLATGQVSLAAFVRMLITEFDVAPLRSEWRDILDRAEGAVG